MTAADIRRKIIEVVGNNGGHLASSLGAVEIAMALAEVFDPKEDAVIWDVGHQAYAWKILTGRDSQFSSIRKFGGLSPFPTPLESECDPAVCGHAGVALSVAEGMAAAYESRKTSRNVVAVIGDAAIANGTSFEALDNCASACGRLHCRV
jgi:1-deoxy-D-xylulose-5-phosphate synthase